MINLDDYTNGNKTEHNPKWPNHPYRMLKIGSESEKTNGLSNLINNQSVLIKYIRMQKIHVKQNNNI